MRAGFVFSEALTGIRRNVTMTVAMVLTTAISLGLLGAGLLFTMLTSKTRTLYEAKIQVSVFLTTDESTNDATCRADVCQDLLTSLQGNPDVDTVDYVSQSESLDRYKKEYQGQQAMLDIVREQALPAFFLVKLKNPQRFAVIRDQYDGKPGVQSVADQSEVVNKLIGLLDKGRIAAVVVAIVQAVAAVLLIANVVQVAALSRRTETNIMRLVGASRWRTQLPFMVEALVGGLVGVALAIGGLVLFKVALLDKVFGSIFQAGLLPALNAADVTSASLILIPIGLGLSAAAAYVTLRLYVRL